MNLKKLFLMLTFFVLMGTTAFAQNNWYVNAATGNDGYDGTQAAFSSGLVGPKATISAMLASSFVVNGDIINIAGNTYNETVVLTKRVQLVGTGSAVTIQNLTLNTGSSTSTPIGSVAAGINQIINISGTLYLQSGRYAPAVGKLNLLVNAVENIAVGNGGVSSGFSVTPTATGNYDMIFSNSAALSFTNTDYPNASGNPRDVVFQGSANVTLPGAFTASRDVTITSGTVVVGANVLSVGRHFVNNSAYTTTTGSVTLAGNGNLSGTGTFQNLITGAITTTLAGNITFVNIDAVTNSVYTLQAGGTLALATFTLTTPGDIVNQSGAASITNGSGGTIVMNGSVTQNFTIVDSQTNTFGNFTIQKPTGSILNFKTASNTVGTMGSYSFTNKFNFVSGQLETNFNNVVIAAAHGTSANIGGPINRNGTSTGVFNLINNTFGVVFGGTGQINIPVLNASPGKTNEFTLLTAIGSNLTVTDGILKTASLTLVNGNIAVYGGGTLTMNGSTVSVTGNMNVGFGDNTAGTITGTSNVTVSGAVSFVGTSATSKIDLTTAGSTPAGNLTVTGALTDGAAGTSVAANTLSVGTLTQTTGSTITTLADLVVGAGGVTGSVAALTVGGNFQSTGAVVFGAGAKAVTGTFTALSAVTTGAGTVTVTGATSVTGALTLSGAGLVWFKSTATLSAGVTTGGANGGLTIDGTSTITGNVIDNANSTVFTFNKATAISGNVTFTHLTSQFILGSAASAGVQASTVGGTISTIATAAGAINLQQNSTSNYTTLAIAKNLTFAGVNNVGAITMGGSRNKLIFNGSAALPANNQVITLGAALTLANGTLEIANSGAGTAAQQSASVSVAGGFNLTVPNLLLTSNGVTNTNLVVAAAGASSGLVTVVGGWVGNGAINLVGAYDLAFNNNSNWPLAASHATTPTTNEWAAGIRNLTLTTGFTGTVTYPSSQTLTGILTVATGRTLISATGLNLTVTNVTASVDVVKVDGTFSGAGTIIVNPAVTQTMSGTGTISNLTIAYLANNVFVMNGPAVLSGNFATSGGAGLGTLTFGTTAFTNVTGTTIINNAIINLPSAGLTLTGSFTHNNGAVTFPTGTGSLNLLAQLNTINAGSYDFTTNTNVFGRLVLMGSAAQTLTLGGPITVARVNINNAAGVTISAFTLTATDLLLTNGLLTHNGLLATTTLTRSITATTNGQIATQPASGPANVTYVGTANGSTGPELLGVLTTLTMNSDIGSSQTITLASGTTIVNTGTLNLSRGTLAAGSFLTFAPGTETVIRADGTLTGTPAFNGTVNLQYLNSGAITTGTEWSSPTAVGTVLINCLGTTVTLGQNSTATGLVTVSFGTLDLGAFNLSLAAGITNNATVTATGGGALVFTGTFGLNGTATTYPNITVNGTGITLTTPALATVTINGNLVMTRGNVTINAGATTLVVNGDFTIATTGGTFTGSAKTFRLNGNFLMTGDDATPAATPALAQDATTWQFRGTANQNITTRNNGTTGFLPNVTINNTAGVTLLSNVSVGNGRTLTLTAGNINTGAFTLTVGVTGISPIVGGSATSMIVGNLNRWATTDATVADATPATGRYVFPIGTTNGKYRPVTLVFTGASGVTNMIKASHTNAAPSATVGIPFTNGGVTVNKMAPLYWTVGMFDPTGTTFLAPGSNPTVTLGAGGIQFGDITLTRAVYRLTSPLNTWTVPGTPGVPYYDANDVATIVHSGVQGWTTEAQQLFGIGYASTFVVANPISAQTLTLGGTAFTKDVTVAPKVFSGNIGTLTFTASSSDVTKATAAITGAGVLTVTAVAAGTAVITVNATDLNGELLSTTFNVTVNAAPAFTAPTAGTSSTLAAMMELTTQNVTFTASGTPTFTLVSQTPVTPVIGTLTAGVLALAPGADAATVANPTVNYVFVVRATGTNGLTTDYTLTVPVTQVNQAPTVTATDATKTINFGAASTVTFTGADADGNALTYTLAPDVTPAYAGTITIANVVNAVTVTMTPATADIGKVFTVSVTANDGTVNSTAVSTAVTVAADLVGTPPAPRLKGDVNDSGGLLPTPADAVYLLNWIVGTPGYTLTDARKWAADVNNDGQYTAYDAASILVKANGGNFLPKTAAAAGTASFSKFTAEKGVFTLPLSLENTSGVRSVYSEITLGSGVEFSGVNGRLPEGWSMTSHFVNGTLKLAMAGVTPLTDGAIAFVNLSLKDKDGSVSIQGNVLMNDQLGGALNAVQIREIPSEFSLSQNYPNPFNPTTSIKYGISENARVSLVVYNVLGQAVRTLVNAEQESGYYTVRWDGTNDFGSKVSSGIYIYRISAGKFTSTVKMNLLK